VTTDDGADIRDKWAVLHEKDKGRRMVAVCIVLSVAIAVVLIYGLVR